MSIYVMSLIWSASKHKGSELLLQLALADFADDTGNNIYPSVATLARKTRMTDRNVQLLIRAVTRGKNPETRILSTRGYNGVNKYHINVPLLEQRVRRGEKFSPLNLAAWRMKSSAQGVKSSAQGVKSSANHRVKPASPNPDPSVQIRHRSIREPSSSCNPGLIAHYKELMMMHFGIDRTVAEDLAHKPHVTEAYLQQWIKHSQRDLNVKTLRDDSNILGAGFYVDRIRRGLEP